jgi:hypothetical protein
MRRHKDYEEQRCQRLLPKALDSVYERVAYWRAV